MEKQTKEEMNWKSSPKGVFLVNLLGIIFDSEKRLVLIGRNEDPQFPQVTWGFPGGRADYGEDLEHYLKSEIKKETGFDVESLGVILAKTYPEKRHYISIYYLCELVGGKEKLGGYFKEMKWVKPQDLEKYFTTSFHPKLKEFIMNLK